MRNRMNHTHPQTPDFKGISPAVPRAIVASLRFQRNALALLCTVLAGWIALSPNGLALQSLRGTSECRFYFGKYRGPNYYSKESGTVGEPKCLVESKWLKLSQHSVRFPGSITTFDDWMWIDYHDRINVLVEAKRNDDGERRFLVFEQSKYALEGRSSKAIVGGIIEPGESPEGAARREVDEEMNGLKCEKFHALGRYRTDVNRGMGWLNAFLATDCDHDAAKENRHVALADEVGVADTERQRIQSVTLTELREMARNGRFLEVQWTATVALALLHLELIETR